MEDEVMAKSGGKAFFNRLTPIAEGVGLILNEKYEHKMRSDADQDRSLSDMQKALLAMVEVKDAMERYLSNIDQKLRKLNEEGRDVDDQTAVWIGYFKSADKELDRKLKKLGLSEIQAQDGKAVPGLHTIENTRRVDGLSDDSIVGVIEKGYIWKGQPLRKSKVITVNNSRNAQEDLNV